MTWLVWRQHRKQALFALLALAALAASLIPTGLQMHREVDRAGLDDCLPAAARAEFVHQGLGPNADQANDRVRACQDRAGEFAGRFGNRGMVGILLWFLPLFAGLFWGAPLVAREVEHGTHRPVWTQGVSRLRWAVVKFGLVGAGVVMAAACYALLLTWWRAPLDQATGQRFLWPLFDLEGPVLVGYTLFALALGVFAGAPTRKTLPAVAITLAGFLATRLPVGLLARPRFLAPLERTFPVAGTAAPNQLTGDWMGRAAPAAEARPPRSMSRPSHARRVVMVADQPLDPVGKGGVVADEPIGAVAGAHKGHLVPADLDIRMVACGLGGVVEDAAAQVVSVSSLMVRPSASSPAASGSPRSRSTSRMKMS